METIVRLHPDDLDLLAKKIISGMVEARSMPEKYVDLEELSTVCGIPTSTIYKYSSERRKNGFPCGKAGKELRFKVSEVQEWMKKRNK
jgi:predicted DNA-binding transcriptional regulator AlpA